MDLIQAKKKVDNTLEIYTSKRDKSFLKGLVLSIPISAAIGIASGFVVKSITHDDEKALRVSYIVAGSGEVLYLLYKGLIKDSTPFNCNFDRLKEMKKDLERGFYNPLENTTEEEFQSKYDIPTQRQKKLGKLTQKRKKDA